MFKEFIQLLQYFIFCFSWLSPDTVLAKSETLAPMKLTDARTNGDVRNSLGFSPLPVSSKPSLMNANEARLTVSVTTNKLRYQSGEIIMVTLHNRLLNPISTPTQDPAGYTNLMLQKFVDGRWVRQGFCDTKATNLAIGLDPKSRLTGALAREIQQTQGIEGPYFGKPSASGVVMGNQTLLSPKPDSEDLTRMVPEGNLNVRGFLGGTLSLPLAPGKYRIIFYFIPGTASSVQTVSSEPFVVDD